MRRRPRLVAAVTAAAVGAVAAVVFVASRPGGGAEAADPLRVGAGPEAESQLLAAILVELLAAEAIPAQVERFGDARDARRAVELGDVEVLPSYTGAVWMEELGWADPPRRADASYERVREADEQRHRVEWLDPTGVNATFALVVQGPPSVNARLDDLSDLLEALTPVEGQEPPVLCVDPAFAERPDGLAELKRLYGFRSEVDTATFVAQQVLAAPPEDAVQGVAHGDCLAGLTTVTDGRVWALGLQPLRDSLPAFPAFVLAPVVERGLEQRPDVVAALAPFTLLEEADLREWNGRALREPIEAVAADAARVLRERHAAGAAPTAPPS